MFTAEGEAIAQAFKEACAEARSNAFEVRESIMIQRGDRLIMINKHGEEVAFVKRLDPIVLRDQ